MLILTPGFPGIVPGEERLRPPPAVCLGAHTDEILAGDLGLGDREMAKLHDDGIVAGAKTRNHHA